MSEESDQARANKNYSARLALTDRVFSEVCQAVLAWLEPLQGCHLLDAGCGAGGMTRAFVTAVGETGHITALDVSLHHLETTEKMLQETELIKRVTLKQGSVDELPFADGTFDTLWCSHVVHGQGDMLHTLRELARVLRVGGRLLLREDVAAGRLLPSEPAGLEEHVRAFYALDQASWLETLPNVVKYGVGWPVLLQQAGFHHLMAKTFTLDLLQPLTLDEHTYLAETLAAWLEDAPKMNLSEYERETLERFAHPSSHDYLLKRSDLHVVSCLTVYSGVKA
jgi:arsenite methyltransferase